jgi:8-oxo-dGTP pyrophosphatase MutT (NUDIX family)
MTPGKISIDQAKPDKLFYFIANVSIYRESDGRCLILKRDEREKVFPGKWGTPGGKLEHADFNIISPDAMNGDVPNFHDPVERLLQRETMEEANVTLYDDLHYLRSVCLIRPDGVPVINVIFAARYKEGEVKPEVGAFTDFAWVNATEIADYDCIGGVAEEVIDTITHFNKKEASAG